jgi:single-strand DNA-binding protein
MNTVSLTGHLTRDPELRSMGETEKKVCEMRLAVDNRPYDSTFVDVKAFGKNAPNCARYLTKGSRIEVTGRLQLEEWQAKDGGGRRSKHVVYSDRVSFPPKGSNGASSDSEEPSATAEPQPVAAGGGSDSDIPF